MSNEYFLKAEKRQDVGKGASRRLRRENKVPAVIYGGEAGAQSVTLKHNEIVKLLQDDAVFSQIIDIEVDGEVTETVFRDLQRHPYKPTVLHADFQRVVRGMEITVNVPIHFLNTETAVGVKAGGIVTQHMINVEISCRPRLLPKAIEVDIAELDMHEVIRLADLNVPEGVTLVDYDAEDEDTNVAVVSIHPPKQEVVEEEDAEEVDPNVEATSQKADDEDEDDKEKSDD